MQIPTYKNYKKGNEEWLPLVPSHWKLTRFQWIGSFESGKAHEPFVDDDGDYICVNSRFISTNGKVIKRCTKNITPASPGDTLAVMSDLPNGRALHGMCLSVILFTTSLMELPLRSLSSPATVPLAGP